MIFRIKTVLLGILLSFVISGCSFLPVPIQVASWAVDGLSMIATKKSISDHGLSLVIQKDCAVWRGITHGSICREFLEDPIVAQTPNIKISQPYLEII